MAHRTFRDQIGQRWEVWSVYPTKVERRERQIPIPLAEERRAIREYRVALGPAMANGWLCFESNSEKRRLSPLPEGWEELNVEGLLHLLGNATVVRRIEDEPLAASLDPAPAGLGQRHSIEESA